MHQGSFWAHWQGFWGPSNAQQQCSFWPPVSPQDFIWEYLEHGSREHINRQESSNLCNYAFRFRPYAYCEIIIQTPECVGFFSSVILTHLKLFSRQNIYFLFVGSISTFYLGICGKQESSSGYMACHLNPQESPHVCKCRIALALIYCRIGYWMGTWACWECPWNSSMDPAYSFWVLVYNVVHWQILPHTSIEFW